MSKRSVLPKRRIQEQTLSMAILGHIAQASFAAISHRGTGDVIAEQRNRSGISLCGADDRVDQFGLAVPLDTGNADNLTFMDPEADAIDNRTAVGPVDRQIAHLKCRLVGDSRVRRFGAWQFASDHQFGEIGCGDVGSIDRVDCLAATEHGDPVSDLQHFLQLVVDEDDRRTISLQLAQVVEQLFDFLRNKHGGRLVENQDFRPAIQHLDDLNTLLLADLERFDEVVRIDIETVRAADFGDVLLGGGKVDTTAALDRLRTEDHVLEHRQIVGKHEVLVHHADALSDRIGGRREFDFFASDAHLALVSGARHDLHQRRLACTVRAYDRMDLALLDREVDVVVCNDAWKALCDANQFDCRYRHTYLLHQLPLRTERCAT